MATKPRMVGLQGGITLVACQLIWMTGCIITTTTALIRERCVAGEHPCKH
jgi:hypothetical protein